MNGVYDGLSGGPKVILRHIDTERAEFILQGVDLSFANSLRRIMIADIPTVGESIAFRVIGCDLQCAENGNRQPSIL